MAPRRRKDAVPPDAPALFELTPVVPSTEPQVAAIEHALWTESKARLIARYLYYFVFVTKHGTYIDAFAGPQRPSRPDMWAAKLVLANEPRWLRHFFLFEQRKKSCELLEALKAEQPARKKGDAVRDITIYPGNSNEEVRKLLALGSISLKDATFCLLDQRTFECEWATVEALARYKPAAPRIELFYFFASGWLDRAIANQKRTSVLDAWWGRSDWNTLRGLSNFDRVQTVCDRFRNEFGYASVKAWPIQRRLHQGRVLYHMVHATDHREAPILMSRAYRKAVTPAEPLEQMKLEIQEELRRELSC